MLRNPRLKTNIVQASATIDLREEMWQLYNRYYTVTPQSFFKRFESNDYYALYTSGDELVGFTGLRIKTIQTEFGPAQTLYVGQSVIHRSFRAKSLIPRTCCRLFIQWLLSDPFRPVYIWCDALTYKPYLLFANSLLRFYPSRKSKTPAKERAIINQLGKEYYGAAFNPEMGTVRKNANIITDPSTLISERDRQNPDIDFFTKANPNYAAGHGLITMAPIGWTNLLFLIGKCFKKRLSKSYLLK